MLNSTRQIKTSHSIQRATRSTVAKGGGSCSKGACAAEIYAAQSRVANVTKPNDISRHKHCNSTRNTYSPTTPTPTPPPATTVGVDFVLRQMRHKASSQDQAVTSPRLPLAFASRSICVCMCVLLPLLWCAFGSCFCPCACATLIKFNKKRVAWHNASTKNVGAAGQRVGGDGAARAFTFRKKMFVKNLVKLQIDYNIT